MTEEIGILIKRTINFVSLKQNFMYLCDILEVQFTLVFKFGGEIMTMV